MPAGRSTGRGRKQANEGSRQTLHARFDCLAQHLPCMAAGKAALAAPRRQPHPNFTPTARQIGPCTFGVTGSDCTIQMLLGL